MKESLLSLISQRQNGQKLMSLTTRKKFSTKIYFRWYNHRREIGLLSFFKVFIFRRYCMPLVASKNKTSDIVLWLRINRFKASFFIFPISHSMLPIFFCIVSSLSVIFFSIILKKRETSLISLRLNKL